MDRLVAGILIAAALTGCHVKGLDSHESSFAENQKSPYKGDPYAWGGIQEGTGGLVVGTKQTMESPTYSEPKFKKLAGPDGYTSMSGHQLAPAKPNDRVGDHQPLPGGEAHGSEKGSAEGH